jgi:hypothetical protein
MLQRWQSPGFRWRAGMLVLMIIAIPLRMNAMGRSLWLDEVWVANSLLEPNLSSMLYYGPWLQTTPPVFLLLERLAINILPISSESLRLLPLLFGLLGIGAMAYLALRLLDPRTAFLVLFLFVFSPAHVIYSQSLKQYTCDTLVSIVLIVLGLFYLQHRTTAWLIASLGAFVALAGLSYNAILFTPALLYGALFKPPTTAMRLPVLNPRWPHAFAVVGAVAVTAIINYVVFIAPNLNENILGAGSNGTAHSRLAVYAWLSLDVVRIFKHFFFNYLTPRLAPWIAALVAALVALIGLLHLCDRGGRGRPRNLDIAVVLVLPIAGAFALDLLGYYPLWAPRLNLFLFPALLILFGVGIQALVARGRLTAKRRRAAWVDWILARSGPVVGLGLVVVLLLRVALDGPSPFVVWREANDEDARAAVAYVAKAAGPRDVVYVDASMVEQTKFYTRFTPINGPSVVRGNIAWPCCPRDAALDRRANPQRALRQEVGRILGEPVGNALWMLYTDRESHWRFVGADNPALFNESLQQHGCARTASPEFEGVRLDKYRCPTAPSLARRSGRS